MKKYIAILFGILVSACSSPKAACECSNECVDCDNCENCSCKS